MTCENMNRSYMSPLRYASFRASNSFVSFTEGVRFCSGAKPLAGLQGQVLRRQVKNTHRVPTVPTVSAR